MINLNALLVGGSLAAILFLHSAHALADEPSPRTSSPSPLPPETAPPPPAASFDDEHAQLPYAVPRQTLIPGTPGMAGGFHIMLNGFAEAQNAGLGGHQITNAGVRSFDGGATYPLLVDDWAMVYGRDARGYVEGLLMLDFEPLTIGPAGIPELGQSGEGLWDAQHPHQLFHQAMVAVHPLAGLDAWHPEGMIMKEGTFDLSIFGGQGSATIGPPIFMHRASSPGPTVPRKHHKGENPHETAPVIGAALRIDTTSLEASAFNGKELTPADSRLYPHVGPPTSFAARVRHDFGNWLEMQVSAERLVNQGSGLPDAYQVSASAYAYGDVSDWRFDGLLDWAIDVPDGHPNAEGALGELATRTPNRRTTLWTRFEFNQREESPALGGFVSTPWLFGSVGAEHVVLGGEKSGLQLGFFGEGTLAYIPESLQAFYGRAAAATVNVGIHVFGMWMLDGGLRPMHHAM